MNKRILNLESWDKWHRAVRKLHIVGRFFIIHFRRFVVWWLCNQIDFSTTASFGITHTNHGQHWGRFRDKQIFRFILKKFRDIQILLDNAIPDDSLAIQAARSSATAASNLIYDDILISSSDCYFFSKYVTSYLDKSSINCCLDIFQAYGNFINLFQNTPIETQNGDISYTNNPGNPSLLRISRQINVHYIYIYIYIILHKIIMGIMYCVIFVTNILLTE